MLRQDALQGHHKLVFRPLGWRVLDQQMMVPPRSVEDRQALAQLDRILGILWVRNLTDDAVVAYVGAAQSRDHASSWRVATETACSLGALQATDADFRAGI